MVEASPYFQAAKEIRSANAEAVTAAPPPLPSDARITSWLQRHADDLLDTIEWLTKGDPDSKQNYLNYEDGKRFGLYQKIRERMIYITFLLTGQ